MKKTRKIFLSLIFYSYVFVLLIILFWRSTGEVSLSPTLIVQRLRESSNLIPLHTVKSYIKAYEIGTVSSTVVLFNIVGNILIFVPMGILLPLLTPLKKAMPFLITSALTVTSIELIQLITGLGRLDVDDLILNLIGALVGYTVYRVFAAVKKRHL